MSWLGWLGAAVIGLSLGVMGSGGSILTVPVLTFILGQEEKLAIAGSLAIVGGISLVAALPYAVRGTVNWLSLVTFGVPGMAGAYLGAMLSQYVSGGFQLLLLAVVMLGAAGFMIKRPGNAGEQNDKRQPIWLIALEGLVVGVVTGLVGVGGGFLIVPALVLLAGLPMRQAVGTSLLIIALKSFVAFYKYQTLMDESGLTLDWSIISSFIAIGILGSFLGARMSTHIPQQALKQAFGVFLVLMGGVIVWRTLPGLF